MLAIYKKELKSYFHSMIGYVFMAFFLAIIGIYMTAYNIVQQVANFEYALHGVTFIFVILVPILTMRLMAEEKKQKTDQLLFTSSVSMTQIICAKFLAVLTLFAVTMGVVCLYPIILNFFGDVPMGTAYLGIFGFLLMGAAFISIGLFISCLTESQIIAAVISFIVLLISYLGTGISTLLPTNKLLTMIVTIFLFTVFCYIIYLSIRKIVVAAATWVVGTTGLVLLYFFHSSFYDNLLSKLVNAISITVPFTNFCYGTIKLADVLYYLSIIALFLILAILFVKETLSDKKRRGSTFRTGFMVVVVILCVVVNLFAKQLNMSIDVSANKMYTITTDTKEFVEKIKDDITIYYICREGSEDAAIDKILSRYETLNKKVKVVKKDKVLYPTFTKKYTKDEVADNSIIVENKTNNKFKYVPYADMFKYGATQMGTSGVTHIDVEGQISSALDFVTNETTPVLYYTEGHGEEPLGATITSAINKSNVTAKQLKTVTVTEIPKDCNILMINGPGTDLSDEEVSMIKLYLQKGGKAIFTLKFNDVFLPNYTRLLEDYGIYPEKVLLWSSMVTISASIQQMFLQH